MNYTPAQLSEILTDTSGHTHRITLPAGKMRAEIWTRQKAVAAEILPAAYAELVHITTTPFVQAITDVTSSQHAWFSNPETPRASFFSSRLLFAGDAFCAFRPHVARSTDQAALNALLLEKVLKGEMQIGEWERRCLAYAEHMSAFSAFLGCRFQFGMGSWETVRRGAWFGWVLLKQKARGWWMGSEGK